MTGLVQAWRVRSALCALVALAAGGCSWVSRMSLSSSGAESNADSFGAVLSADGRYVAFESLASISPGTVHGVRPRHGHRHDEPSERRQRGAGRAAGCVGFHV